MLLVGAERGGEDLVVGLVNNMPPSALRKTEAQFAGLLQDASAGLRVRLRCFTTCSPRDQHHEDLAALWSSELDGLIVTGAEPRAAQMAGEPLWPLLADVVDWAAANTRGAVFSCLAAHAAVYRLSGLPRRQRAAKLSGIYSCSKASNHPFMVGAPAQWLVPHSRHNDIDPALLRCAGYEVLSTGPGLAGADGADSFTIAAGTSQFLMLQGHPEYGADSLLAEYRRDIHRFIKGQRQAWPLMPQGYFDADTAARMAELEAQFSPRPTADVMALFNASVSTLPIPRWQAQGVRLMNAWLKSLGSPAVALRTVRASAGS